MQIEIVGAGGVGGFLADSLLSPEVTPRLVLREGATLSRVRNAGLTVRTGDAVRVRRLPAGTARELAPLGPLLFLTPKTYDLPGALAALAPHLRPDALVITLQNGFGAVDMARAALGPERVSLGVVYVGAQIVEPGVVAYDPQVRRLCLDEARIGRQHPVVRALISAGVQVTLAAEIEREMWLKQLFLVPFAMLNAETGEPIGGLRENPELRRRWANMAEEIAATAHAAGAAMPEQPGQASLNTAERFPPHLHSSFGLDYRGGRPHEAAALLRPILERAARFGIACPQLEDAWRRFGGKQP